MKLKFRKGTHKWHSAPMGFTSTMIKSQETIDNDITKEVNISDIAEYTYIDGYWLKTANATNYWRAKLLMPIRDISTPYGQIGGGSRKKTASNPLYCTYECTGDYHPTLNPNPKTTKIIIPTYLSRIILLIIAISTIGYVIYKRKHK